MSISNTVKSIQDIMRKDTGVDGDAQRIGQLVWMLFLKVFDDKETEWEMTKDHYQSPIPENLRWRNWAAKDEGLTGEDWRIQPINATPSKLSVSSPAILQNTSQGVL